VVTNKAEGVNDVACDIYVMFQAAEKNQYFFWKWIALLRVHLSEDVKGQAQ
jgi:hypothetical protein